MTAETKPLKMAINVLFPLQWSRGLLTAETHTPAAEQLAKGIMLQWSRGLLTAET